MSIRFSVWGERSRSSSHFQAAHTRRLLITALVAAAVSACSDSTTAPEPVELTPTTRWNAIARELVISDRASPPMAGRAYAYLSVAQYAAAVAAYPIRPGDVPSLASLGRNRDPSNAAIATVSASVLRSLFPSHGARIDHELQADIAALRGEDVAIDAMERGESIGAAVAASIQARASTDRADAVWTGTVPNGDGYWIGTAPQLPLWGAVRPWLWNAGSELRAPPPPAFQSQEFRDALAEVREIAETRTPAQMEIARFWADGPGTSTPPGHWNAIASQLIRDRHLTELHAARTLALVNVAMADAFIGCWDSKFFYWVVRPYQADPAITTPIGQPPHPSYPSGHACGSSAAAAVLAALFPDVADELDRMAVEACDSRVYAGIHYRFDAEAGMAIGVAAAERTLERADELVRSEVARTFAANE